MKRRKGKMPFSKNANQTLKNSRSSRKVLLSIKTHIEPRTLHFKKPAGTSRGVYQTHDVWYVRVTLPGHPEQVGLGECAPLPGLSQEAGPHYIERLQQACAHLEQTGYLDVEALRACPSIFFGLETALKHLQQGHYGLWDTSFSRAETGIPINGLIWMGSFRDMNEQIREKLHQGFRCIKLKIGAIDFEDELKLLHRIRQEYSPEAVTLRVDANGAFSPAEAPEKIERLSELSLHSIEQPLGAGQKKALAALIRSTPLPIALDEELIGHNLPEDKRSLLETLRPQYIVLKPSLHGGWAGCREWIDLAEEKGIGWWITSALESNIGLNAVAQWCATLNNPLHQGLGTGMLYTDNVEMPLVIEGERLWFKP
jgi:o-succinylbenzoate synthase